MHNDIIALNNANYAATMQRTQNYFEALVAKHGRHACLHAIKALAIDTGFIKDNLQDAVRYVVRTGIPHLTYRIQYNPARGKRFGGAGRKQAPPGRELEYGGCPLAPANMLIQQCATELPYACELAGTAYNLVAQPFPFEDVHLIAATRHFRAQDVPPELADQILREMCALATWSPDFMVLLNGSDGAGATINWFHLQQFTRPAGELFPLEDLAQNQITDNDLRLLSGYPLPVVVTRGPIEQVVADIGTLIRTWINDYGSAATMNLFATTYGCAEGTVTVYFCPRDRRNCNVPAFSGAVGGLEVLGELLGHSPADKERIDRGQIDAHYVQNVLGAVRAEGFEPFFVHYMQTYQRRCDRSV